MRDDQVSPWNPTLQYITLPGCKERLVVLPEAQYRILEAILRRVCSDPAGRNAPLPDELLARIANGANPVREVRLLRGLTGRQLADMVGISSSMLSQIERNGKTGSTKTFKAIADILDVPLGSIFPSGVDADGS